MIYLVAIFIPPLALIIEGKIFQAVINAVFWILGIVFVILGGFILWAITIIHAVIVVHGARSDARTQKIVDAINTNKEN
ncbi:MAG: YqaE/Pmp3 family membrane protein [Alphaproteobacteria bacterium]|nr:MAG: YqaE/Pmp3 family membrane protein [Alphaproteobacteria bacterium]